MHFLELLLFIALPSSEWQVPLSELEIYSFDGFSTNMAAVAGDGSMMLKDPTECRLVFTDPEGQPKKVFGRRGRGPDEFFTIDGMGWVESEQAFYVTDRGTSRISKFDKNGNRIGSFRTEIMRNPVFSDRDLFYMKRNGDAAHYQNAIHRFSLSQKTGQVLFKADMALIATIMIWHGHLEYAPGSDFLVATHTDSNQIHILAQDTGKTLNQWPLNVPRVPLTKEWREAYMKDFMARVFSKGSPPKGFKIEHRDQWPYLHTIKVDAADRIWVFLHRSREEDPVPYYVFNRGGERLKSGKIQGIPQAISGHFLYLIEMNEQDSVLRRIELGQL